MAVVRLAVGGFLLSAGVTVTSFTPPQQPDLSVFFAAASADARQAEPALAELSRNWRNAFVPLLIDLARFLVAPVPAGDPFTVDLMRSVPDELAARVGEPPLDPLPERRAVPPARARLIRLLERQTGQRFGQDLGRWREWMWSLPYDPHPDYLKFKAALYARVDPRMAKFFTGGADIRLDEIDWGGVRVNGIPPLVSPETVPADAADWLSDRHVVFGVVVNGEARAYPKRILAWHELARDTVGGASLTIVYCTLCGTVIPYRSVVGGRPRTFGTSGLVYRSNKLMFDEETTSLWSTLEGRPVVGPLVGSGLTLEPLPVVTTTWGEWRRMHPSSRVLSLDTGHRRDYSEGAAYREYFATDRLMFRVPAIDRRLKNKDEVLALLLPARGGGRQAVAFAVEYLRRHPVDHFTYEGLSLVVVTTTQGANRVYDAGAHRFSRWKDDRRILDSTGRTWLVTEEALVQDGTNGAVSLRRRAAARAFWFGWFAQFPDTLLVK
jgi:hypothetical protein